ncbi:MULTISPECIES: hypothetical protein [Lactobacillales]|uniref:hypothetical protein n=1 Tax=Lactobacillales TaxID=186826 RepID=UPI002FC741A4
MIKGTGYLKKQNIRKWSYFSLFGTKEGKSEKEKLYYFGRYDKALKEMYEFRDTGKMPEELKSLGFTLEDLDHWILTLETRTTRRGKEIIILTGE